MVRTFRIVTALIVLCCTAWARGEDSYYCLLLAHLELAEGSPPQGTSGRWPNDAFRRAMEPYAVLDGPGECYFEDRGQPYWYSASLAVRGVSRRCSRLSL